MEHSLYLSALKQCLKSKGITYSELAKELKMTESGVKKMLNAKDISFRRILRICETLDVLPGQLFSASEKAEIPTVTLTRTQEDALIGDRKLLAAYWLIAIEERDSNDAQSLLKLDGPQFKRLLQRLQRLQLLVCRKGVYKSAHPSKFRWSEDSRLSRILNREWSELILTRALSGKQTIESFHRLSMLNLAQDTHALLNARLAELFDEMARLSEREELTRTRKELRAVGFLAATALGSVF